MADGQRESASRGRDIRLVLQTEATECGLACLAMISKYHGHDIELPQLRRLYGTSLRGSTLMGMVQIAAALTFDARPMRAELDYLPTLSEPCILHWDMNHFVVLNRCARGKADIFDPARGRVRMSFDEMSRHFTGIVLEIKPSPSFRATKGTAKRISLRGLLGKMQGLKRSMLQIFGLALAIEILALALPFQLQWVMDQVIGTSDRGLLVAIAIGFGLAALLQLVLSIGRSWLISWLGATIQMQWTHNLFSHLLELPLDFFQKRHIGDVVSRFNSLQSIQTTLTGGFVEAILDGVFGLLTLAILGLYSPSLTGTVVAFMLAYAALRVLAYRTSWRLGEERLVHSARQQTELMESVRNIQAIKIANKQNLRIRRLDDAVNQAALRDIAVQRFDMAFGAVNRGLNALQRIMVITLGARLVVKNQFSPGMFVAFVAYSDQFGTKLAGFIDKLVEFRFLDLHKDRIEDIALAEAEADQYATHSTPEPLASIEARNLSFRYAESEPWVFRNLNFTIEAGESVAITGPSGCGKSTLAKILLGLLQPTEGSVLVGGVDVRHLGLRRYREMVASVMQDDHLFAGSIADNVTFFDESPNATLEHIATACMRAEIHDDIIHMPMGYESLVGDMGSMLSGGQRQRVILARALYRQPSILLLDEATSHLDEDRECRINRLISTLDMTRIVIAHRPSTIESTDRIISLMSAT
ncbi:peptidase domain-containing ABC transporter [Luteibacter sp. CQ10]|uniref:peptidase domain-containing ABC transporter n=1 Tax=Luteibacter sp. CQ10 TaxID=2805821 RepID=UPI0034A46570